MMFYLLSTINPLDYLWIILSLKLNTNILQPFLIFIVLTKSSFLNLQTLLRIEVITQILLILGFAAAKVSQIVDAKLGV